MHTSGNTYDVVVVGGGPAGALTAYHLAKAGVRTLVLDSSTFPRDKTCGGGLQHRAALRIPFDWRPALRSELDRVCFSFQCGRRFSKQHRDPLMYGILRREFDSLMLDQARSAGAIIRENCTARGIGDSAGEYTTIETGEGPFDARFIVGADGANSVVRPFVNRRSDYYWNAALSCEVPEDCLAPGILDSNTARIDWGTHPGYGWMFPKRGYVNIGVGGPLPAARTLRIYLARFLQTEKILTPGAEARLRFRGHQLPTLQPGAPLSRGRVILVGDAGGMVDPLTGDGISFGLHSADIASQTLLELLRNDHSEVGIYDRRILEEIGAELFWSQKMATFLVAFPRLVHATVEHQDRAWRAFCRVMRGDHSLLAFREKLLPFAFLLRWLGVLAALKERRLLRI